MRLELVEYRDDAIGVGVLVVEAVKRAGKPHRSVTELDGPTGKHLDDGQGIARQAARAATRLGCQQEIVSLPGG